VTSLKISDANLPDPVPQDSCRNRSRERDSPAASLVDQEDWALAVAVALYDSEIGVTRRP